MSRLTNREAAKGYSKLCIDMDTKELSQSDKEFFKLVAIENIEEEFGIDFQAIYTLAKSQIATAKNNIELSEENEKLKVKNEELKHQLEVCEKALKNAAETLREELEELGFAPHERYPDLFSIEDCNQDCTDHICDVFKQQAEAEVQAALEEIK